MGALKRANDIRTARAKIKKDLKKGRVSLAALLSDPPEFLLTARVFDLLIAVPKYGRVKASRVLNQARISQSKTVGGMSERQRRELLSLLGVRGESRGRKSPYRTMTTTSTRTGKRKVDAAEVLLTEWKRLIGERDLDRSTLERVARIAAAEETWRRGLGALFTEDEATQLLGMDPSQLELLKWKEEVIVLPTVESGDRYPAFQFQDGRVSAPLARAHWMLVNEGGVSPWTAASWASSGHPELEGLSPAQWTGDGRDPETLAEVAERDASRLAQ